MSNAKKDILKKIKKKIDSRREAKTRSLDPKDYRAIVFDFFAKFEESKAILPDDGSFELLQRSLQSMAEDSLVERLWSIDPRCRVKVNTTQDGNVQGVTITWSSNFVKTHSMESSVYIDVSEMLLI